MNFQKLNSQAISLLFTHRKLDARSEDDVVDAAILWLRKNGGSTRDKELIYIMN